MRASDNSTRPLCPYPQTAIYNGSGGTEDAANFHCAGNVHHHHDRDNGHHDRHDHGR